MGTEAAAAIVASSAVVAALAGVVQLGRWRLADEAPAMWIGAGLLVYSGAALAVPGVALLVSPTAASSPWGPVLLRPVAVPVVMAIFAAAVGARGGGGRSRMVRSGGACAGVGLLTFAAVAWSPTVRTILGPSLVSAPPEGLASIGQFVVAGAWWALAAAFARSARRTGDAGWWLTTMLVALGASRLCLGVAAGGSLAVAASLTFRVVAVVAALAGTLRGLQALVVSLRRELDVTRDELRGEHARLEEAEAEEGDRRHQLRSGLAAIGGTAWLLEHYERNLGEPTRIQLIGGVTGEVRRLQQLLDHSNTLGGR